MVARPPPPDLPPAEPAAPIPRPLLLTLVLVVLLVHTVFLTNSRWALHVFPHAAATDADSLRFHTRHIQASETSSGSPANAKPPPARRQDTGGRLAPAPAIAPARSNTLSAPLASAPDASAAPPSQETLAPSPSAAVPTPDPSTPNTTPTPEPTVEKVATAGEAPTPPKESIALPAGNPYDPAIYNFSPPPSVRLTYQVQLQVKGFNQSASAELQWVREGDTYNARLEVRHWLAGARTQTSVGQITGSGLAPRRFSDKVRNEVAAHFEPDKGEVIFSANTPSAPLMPGMQDRLSVFMQLASLLAGGNTALPEGARLVVPVVGPRSADLWHIKLEGEESLVLPGGTVNALKLVRQPQKEYDQKLELWLAPAKGFLPVRIRLTEANGDVADQLWQSSQWP